MTALPAWTRRPAGVAALLFGLLVVLLLVLPADAQSRLVFPALTGRVVDQADLLDAATEQALTQKLAALEASSSDQLVVVTVPNLQDREIEEYGYQLGRAWGIGQKEGDNGALLIVAPNERRVRIEVGYGLEPILTDAFSSMVIRNDILPAFRDGDYQAGIVRGVDALITQLQLDPAEAQARAAALAQEEDNDAAPLLPILIIGAIFLLFLIVAVASGARGRRHGGDSVTPILLWAASEALRNAGRGGGSGFGGGGFGGGGGSFGGGGASGGW